MTSRSLASAWMALVAAGTCAAAAPSAASKSISLSPLGTYASGVYNQSAAEIVAHDPATQRVFVINSQAATVDVLSIADPTTPVKVATLDITPYGAVANSVAVHRGLIAVAVEAVVKTDPGRVVFFDRDLTFLVQVTVGALPDMLTFTPNGRYLLVANEGEPNDAYTIDPEGSISVIDLSGNLAKLNDRRVRTAHFRAFNDAALDPSVRIFGPGATVAQDVEPEYITVSHDSRTAWVTLQENNAIATIDIPTATVTALRGLGFKDHALVTATSTSHDFDPAQMPDIGTTLAGQTIQLGGFSGLHFEGKDATTGRWKFVTHTDRGPNAEPTGIYRPFLLPDFAPEIVRFEYDPSNGAVELTQRLPLQRAPGVPLTGLPNTALSLSASQAYNDEVPVNLLGQPLPLDPLGADLEGVVVNPVDGTFWMVDEYRPAIYHFDAAGVLMERYVPIGTAAAAGQPAGTFGREVLPAVLAQRRQNRGFEAVAWDNGKLYAFVQSPLRNPASLPNSTLNGLRNIRVVEFNPTTLQTAQYLYVMDNANLGGAPNSRADKIGDAVALGGGEFLVIERDDDNRPEDAPATIEKKIYRFNLTGATNLSNFVTPAGGRTPDQMTAEELKAAGINSIYKQLYVDLTAAGYDAVQKVEGLALVDRTTLAVINDNDFGVAAITVQPDGTFTRDYVPERSTLGIISLRTQGLDASDEDGRINIRPWPVKGMYQPDAIASYRVGPHTYLVTANEGDARDYAGFSEGARVRANAVVLDPTAFPQASVLKQRANLGQLNITTTLGRDASTGRFEALYAFGARSFSIWQASGEQVFDSGDQLEWLTALAFPQHFNASNSNNTFDNRSDDKGPEPEGLVIGKAFGRDYVFVGLERIGGVVAYDISNPAAPVLATYSNPRDFSQPTNSPGAGDLGPEGLIFVKAEDSPNGRPLLVVGNEVSGTTTIYEISARD